MDASANRALPAEGLAYPTYSATLPAELRGHLAGISRAARPSTGLRPVADGHPGRPATTTAGTLDTTVIWPKLFRRPVPYFAAGFPNLDQFDTWLRADPVHRDDAVWPEDFLIADAGHERITLLNVTPDALQSTAGTSATPRATRRPCHARSSRARSRS